MSKITTFLSSNAALVGGGALATAVAVVALIASGVLDAPEPTPDPAPTVAQDTATPTPEASEEADDTPVETVAPQEGADEAAVVEATPEPEPEPEAAPESVPAPVLPTFDLVRIAPDGEGQVAGTTAPDARVALLLDGEELIEVIADESGKFFTFISLGAHPQPRELLLVERREEGDLTSESAFLVAPIAAPVVVAEVEVEVEETPPSEPAPKTDTASQSVATAVDSEAETEEVPAVETEVETEVASAAETGVEDTQSALQDTAEAEEEPIDAAQAPAVLVSDADGVRVVQPAAASDAPDVTSAVAIDAISYADSGDVVVAGRGLSGNFVRLYLNNALAATLPVDSDGQWSAELADIDSGLYTLRADEVDTDGKVLSRVETPFKRETPERVAEAKALAEGVEDVAAAPTAEPATEAETSTVEEEAPAAAETADVPAQEAASVAEEPAVETAMASAEENPQEATPIAAEPSKPAVQIVTVQPGSSLWAIARDRYGEGTMYIRVFEANQDKIRDPDLIYPGQVFTVPE